jgi:hypothetical protein
VEKLFLVPAAATFGCNGVGGGNNIACFLRPFQRAGGVFGVFIPLKIIGLLTLVFALTAPPAFAGDDWKRELEARFQDGQLKQLQQPDWLWQVVLQQWDRARQEREEEEKQLVEGCVWCREPLWHARERDHIRYWIGAVEVAAAVGAGGEHEGMFALSGLPFVGVALAFAGPPLIVLIIGVIAVMGAIRVRIWPYMA